MSQYQALSWIFRSLESNFRICDQISDTGQVKFRFAWFEMTVLGLLMVYGKYW